MINSKKNNEQMTARNVLGQVITVPHARLRDDKFGVLKTDKNGVDFFEADWVNSPYAAEARKDHGFDTSITSFDGTYKMRAESVIEEGKEIERYGSNFGSYVTDIGTPYEELSLPEIPEDRPYHVFRFKAGFREAAKKAGIRIWKGYIAPAWECPGGGIQYYFDDALGRDVSVFKLIDDGVIEEVVKLN